MPQAVERVCVGVGCDVVLVDRAPSARYCSMRCRKRAEWARVVARERARQAARAAVAASTDGPPRLAGEPFWCWRVRAVLTQARTDEAAALWQRAVELAADDLVPSELVDRARELGWRVPRRWSS